MPLPQIENPTVAPQPVRIPEASAAAFGAQIGQAVEGTSEALVSRAINERHLAVAFDAQDRELKYGVAHDALKEDYENQIRTLNAPDSISFQEKATKLREKFAQDQEALRAKYEGTLRDPLARKAYEIRTRLQTQMAERQMLIFSDAHVRAWQLADTDKGIVLNEERGGNVSGILKQDLEDLQRLRTSNADKVALQLQAGLIPGGQPAGEAKLRSSDRQLALNALQAYDEKENHVAALGFLASVLPDGTKDGTSVVFNPKNPDQPYLLTTAEAQKFVNRFARLRAEKVGKDVGAGWYFDEITNHTSANAEVRAAQLVKDGKIGAADAAQALQEYRSLKSGEYQRDEHARLLSTQAANAAIAKGEVTPEEAQVRWPNADVSSGYRAANGYNVRAGRALTGALSSAMDDPANAGFTAALPRNVLELDLYNSSMPQSQVDRILRSYDKAAKAYSASGKAPGVPAGISVLRDYIRPVLGVNQATSLNLSDLKQKWQLDVRDATELEYYHRIEEAQRRSGAKAITQEEIRQIASDVGRTAKDLKERARRGEEIVPHYPPPAPSQSPTPEQNAAAARVRALSSGKPAAGLAIDGPDPRIPGSKVGEAYEDLGGGRFRRTK